jgi:hypothetical protein
MVIRQQHNWLEKQAPLLLAKQIEGG